MFFVFRLKKILACMMVFLGIGVMACKMVYHPSDKGLEVFGASYEPTYTIVIDARSWRTRWWGCVAKWYF